MIIQKEGQLLANAEAVKIADSGALAVTVHETPDGPPVTYTVFLNRQEIALITRPRS